MSSKEYSNLGATDVLASQKYLAERGYEVNRILECSSFDAVLLAKNIQSQQKVAIKLIFFENEKQLLRLTEQFEIMKNLESPYIVHLLDILTDLENNYAFLIMDFEENGNLDKFLRNHPNISDSQIITMFIEILRGLIFLKDNHIIHANLKPERILLSSSNSPKISNVLESRAQQIKGGNFIYQAPEQFINQQSQIESDWFAAGLILFQLCGNNDLSQMFQIKYGCFPDSTQLRHQNIVEVAFRMLKFSPKDRASPEEVITELQKIHQSFPPPKPEIQRIQYGDGFYEGETTYNIPNGQGKKFWNSGNRYEGEWENGKRHGQGKFFRSDGDRYEGEWENGQRHGQGKFFGSGGDRYEGEWKDDKKHGQGKFFWRDGDRYEGEWKDGQRHGQGKFFRSDGDRYEGEWENGKRHGKGNFFQNNGDRYEGNWKDGKKHGQGKFLGKNGDYYLGLWEDDNRQVQGHLFSNYGDRYEGEWKEDKENDEAKLFQNDEDSDVGKLVHDQLIRQGQKEKLVSKGQMNGGKVLVRLF